MEAIAKHMAASDKLGMALLGALPALHGLSGTRRAALGALEAAGVKLPHPA